MRARPARPAIHLALVAAALACSDADANRAGGGAAEIEAIEVTEIGRIGSLDDPEQSLTRVGNVVIGPGERLYVAQPADVSIRVFDSTDAAAGTIGREGEGPGEFQELSTIGLRGDTLYAFDTGGPRVSYFALDGTHLRSRRVTGAIIRADGTTYMTGIPRAFAFLPDGGGVLRPLLGSSTPISTRPIIRVDSALQVVDTVTLEVLEGRGGVEIARGGTTYRVVSPFEDHPLTTILPDGGGVAIVERRGPSGSEPAAVRVTRLEPTGDTAFSSSLPYDPVALSNERVRAALAEARVIPAPEGDGPGATEIERAFRDAGLLPDSQTPVTAVVGTQDGRIWLRRGDAGADTVAWTVLDREGEVRGEVHLPADQRVVAAENDLLVALELDELDVPYLVRYRLGGG